MNSLIVPCYNARKTIDRLLKSVPDDIELIIVEDGSSDPIDPPDCVYIKQENAGPGEARNTGLNHATGEYVFFADADDELIEFDWQPYLNHDIVYAGFYDNLNGVDVPKLTKSFGCVYGVAYRRQFLVDNGIKFPPWIQREDLVFNTMCQALTDDWAHVYAGVYRRYVTEGSITTTRDFNRTELPYLAKEIAWYSNNLDNVNELCTRTYAYMYWLHEMLDLTEQEEQEYQTELKKLPQFEFVDWDKYSEKNKQAVKERLGGIT